MANKKKVTKKKPTKKKEKIQNATLSTPYVEINFDNYCKELEKYCKDCYQHVLTEYGNPTEFSIGWSDGGFWDCVRELYWGAKVHGEYYSGTLSPVPDELRLDSLPYSKFEKLRHDNPEFDDFFKNENGEDFLDTGFYWWPPGEAGHWLGGILFDGVCDVRDALLKIEAFSKCGLEIAPHDTVDVPRLTHLSDDILELRDAMEYTPSAEFLQAYFSIFTGNERKIAQWMEVATKGKLSASDYPPNPELEQYKTELFSEDEDADRTGAAYNLADYEEQGEKILYEGLFHENSEVRYAACYGLRYLAYNEHTLNGTTIEKLNDILENEKDDATRAYALNALFLANTEGLEKILFASAHSDNSGMRYVAIEGLEHYTLPGSYPVYLQALVDEDESVRDAAAHALGELGDVRAVPALQKALNDKEDMVLRSVIIALGKLRDKSSVNLLLKFLEHENEYVKEAGILALGYVATDEIVDVLLGHLKTESDFGTRMCVIQSLVMSGSEKAIESILPELETKYSEVTADALRECGNPLVIPALIELLNDEKKAILAAKTLRDITGQEGLKKDINRWRQWWATQT